jgi:hypothetical protein
MPRFSTFAFGALLGALTTGACVSTPSGVKFTPEGAQVADAAFAAACTFEAAIPVVGSDVVKACPGETATFDAVTALETAPAAPPPTASPVPLFRAARAGEKPAAVVGGKPLAHAGWALPGPGAAVTQAALLAPRAPLVLPVVARDAGRDGAP